MAPSCHRLNLEKNHNCLLGYCQRSHTVCFFSLSVFHYDDVKGKRLSRSTQTLLPLSVEEYFAVKNNL